MKHFRTLVPFVAVLCLLAFPILIGDSNIDSLAVTVLLLTGAAVAWNIFSGYTGYISLGHATYSGIGSYVLAMACQDWHIPGGWGPFLLLPLTGLIAGAFAVPLGWIALHAERYTFLILTIAIFFIFQLLAYNLQGFTGGSEGIFLPSPDWSAELLNLPFYFAACALLLLAVLLSWRIRHSKYGLGLLAIRDDEDRARGLGIRTGRYKLGAYVLSAALIGMEGALTIYFLGFVNPSVAFDQSFGFTIVAASFLGGVGTVLGPIVGGLLFAPVQTFLIQQFAAAAIGLDQILFGGFLLVIILLMPEGIVPSLRKRWQVWKASLSRMKPPVMGTPSSSLAIIPVVGSEHLDLVDVKGMKEQNVHIDQMSNKIDKVIFPIPDRQSGRLHPPINETQKVKALRLIPLSPRESMTKLEPAAFTPTISWRCPSCRRPFLLRGNICYCPRCGFMRQLTEGIS